LLLDEIVRDGGRQMLASALLAEVAADIEAQADQLGADGHRLVVRNGYHEPREVMTAAGALPVRAPRVNDKRADPQERSTQAVLFGDPAGLVTQVTEGGRGAAAAATSRVVDQRLRPGAGTVSGQRRRAVRRDDHPADQPVARRRGRVRQAPPR
jgi:hypothetical protein